MKGATKAMGAMNRKMNLPQIQKIMMDFERESEFMDMKEEMMNDAIDDAVEEEDDETETNEIVAQVLDEIGIDMNQQVIMNGSHIDSSFRWYSCGLCTLARGGSYWFGTARSCPIRTHCPGRRYD